MPFKVRISALGDAGNVARSFVGAGHDHRERRRGSGTGGGTTLGFTNGVLASHSVSFNNTGSTFSLMVTYSPGVSGTSNTFPVAAGPGSSVQQPTNSVAGAIITPGITVELQDALGNIVSQSGVQIVMELNTGTGILTGTKTRTTNLAGLATFANLSIDSAGVKRLRARSGTLTPAVSDSFAISAGSASKLAFVVQPGTGNGGAPLAVQPVIALQDQFGNTVTGTAETVTLAIQTNPSQGVLSGTRTVVDQHADGASHIHESFRRQSRCWLHAHRNGPGRFNHTRCGCQRPLRHHVGELRPSSPSRCSPAMPKREQ